MSEESPKNSTPESLSQQESIHVEKSQENSSNISIAAVLGEGISESDFPEAIRAYKNSGFTIVPIYGPHEGTEKQRGKAPKVKGFQKWTPDNLNDENIHKFWSDRPSNVAILLKGPHVVIDVDSKADNGVSAREWIDNQPELANIPREDTPNGAHLHIECEDLPPFKSKTGKPFLGKLTGEPCPDVTVELFHAAASHAIVVSPSIHPSGQSYRWVKGGELPRVHWTELKRIFAFQPPNEAQKKEQADPSANFHLDYRGDLKTLDIVSLTKEAGIYGQPIDADSGRHSIRCPFREEHSDANEPWTADDTSTVVFEGSGDGRPAFKCQHAHCSERGFPQFLEAVETHEPGIVDRHCDHMRVWEPGQKSPDGRQRIPLPGKGRPQGIFAKEVAQALKMGETIFSRNDHVVEVRPSAPGDETAGSKLDVIEPAASVTRFEREIEFGRLRNSKDGEAEFVPDSITKPEVLLKSPELRDGLLRIQRILDTPVPVIHQGEIVFPKHGYDPRFETFVAGKPRAFRPMSQDEAFTWINELLGNEGNEGFCWDGEQSFVHAVARVITPLCRGLMNWAKVPIFLFIANRPRAGKDTAAQIPLVLYTGQEGAFPPLGKGDDAEMRKRITSCLKAGSPFLHIANLKGYVDFPSLEGATDNTRTYRDRLLSSNTELALVNEMEYSISANSGVQWTPDLEGRSRRIGLFFPGEDINARRFRHPDLLMWVKRTRFEILDALFALIQVWDAKGRPDGPTPFASFPEWARIVGGVLHANGIGDPCLPHEGGHHVGGNSEDDEMKRFFELARTEFGDDLVRKDQLYDLVDRQEELLFGYWDLTERSGQTSFGKRLSKYEGRELSAITLKIDKSDKHRLRYGFLDAAAQTLQTLQTFTLGRKVDSTLLLEGANQAADSSADREKPTEDCNVCDVCYSEPRSRATDRPHSPQAFSHVYVAAEHQFDKMLEELRSSPVSVALDIETFSDGRRGALDPWTNSVRLISICFSQKPFVIDVDALESRVPELLEVLKSKVLIAHNARFDLLSLREKFGFRPRAAVCTMTLSRLLSAGEDEMKHDLGSVLERQLGISLPKDQGSSAWGAENLSDAQIQYAADDVMYLYQLALTLLEAGRYNGLEAVMKLETDLIPVLLDMEFTGFPADRERLEDLISKVEADLTETESNAKTLLEDQEINLNSGPQLIEAFGRLGVSLDNVQGATLQRVNHPAATAVLARNQNRKFLEQARGYYDSIREDGRIHCEWKSSTVKTGRFSSNKPNLQNVPRGPLRAVFHPLAGRKFVVADYSQIELRVAAVLSKDPLMLETFKSGDDIHRRTAAALLSKKPDEISAEERQKAKAVNFGFLFGQGARGFVQYAQESYGVNISHSDAKAFRNRWLRAFPGISNWQRRCERDAGSSSVREVRTLTGRRRFLPHGSDKGWKRKTTLLNTPVQGTAGDGLKRALLRVAREIPEDCQVVSSIHDEIIVECPEISAESVRRQVEAIMVEEMESLLKDVPVEVEANVCDSWDEKN